MNWRLKPCKFSCYDGYNLTEAAINGIKTQRRVIAGWKTKDGKRPDVKPPTFKPGEVLYLIQAYKDIPELNLEELRNEIGWNNKMFAKVALLPYRVRILSARTEELQSITDEDAIAEGVIAYHHEGLPDVYSFENNKSLQMYEKPRDAFKAMCDGLFGIGVWRRNPEVYVYEFETFRIDKNNEKCQETT